MEEIEENRQTLYDLIYDSIKKAVEGTFMYLEQLKQQNKALGKGIHSLMQSRSKWKRRYYKLRRKIDNTSNKDIEELCNECSTIVEESGLTEEDIDRIVAKSKETQRKAEKYDLLVKKLKEMRKSLNKDGFAGYADDITDILAEVEEEEYE